MAERDDDRREEPGGSPEGGGVSEDGPHAPPEARGADDSEDGGQIDPTTGKPMMKWAGVVEPNIPWDGTGYEDCDYIRYEDMGHGLGEVEPPSGEWLNHLDYDTRGSGKKKRLVLASTCANFRDILLHDPEWKGRLAYNARKSAVELLSRPPWPEQQGYPVAFEDMHQAKVAAWLVRHQAYGVSAGLRVSAGHAELAAGIELAAREHTYDPVIDWLEELPEWDGVERIKDAPHWCLGAEKSEITSEFFIRWMISAVARAYKPGCKVDHVLVLVGDQGAGKSTIARYLAIEPEWFGDNLPEIGTKDASDYVHGPWIIEMAELESLKRSEMGAVKAFITRAEDRFRPAYGRRMETRRRRCVFIASTNEDTFLRDSTGNRRFWPVRVGTHGPVNPTRWSLMLEDYWAEALARYRRGERWWLDGHHNDLARQVQEASLQVDEWEPLLAEWLDAAPRAHVDRFTSGELLEAVGLKPDRWSRGDQMRVGQIMQRLRWERRRLRDEAGARRWFYLRPGTSGRAG